MSEVPVPPPSEPSRLPVGDPSAERPQGFVRVNVSQPDLIFAAINVSSGRTGENPLSNTVLNDDLFSSEHTEVDVRRKGDIFPVDNYGYYTSLYLTAKQIEKNNGGYYNPDRIHNLMAIFQKDRINARFGDIGNGNQRIMIYGPDNKDYGIEMILGWPSRESYYQYEYNLNRQTYAGQITDPQQLEEQARKQAAEAVTKNNTQISIHLSSKARLAGDFLAVASPTIPQDKTEFYEQTEFYRKGLAYMIQVLYKEADVTPRVEINLRPPNKAEDILIELQSAAEPEPRVLTKEQVVPEKLTLNDVKGQDRAVQECRRLVRAINEPEKYERRGVKPPKGVLLVGPSGTGKTMIARAIQSETDADFIQINAANIGSKWINESAQKVNAIFDDAVRRVKAGRKVILFVDEIDAVTQNREGVHPEDVKTISIFLQRLDGLVESKGVTLLATTNRPNAIDPAIMRPGRIDRIIEVPLPEARGRTAILESKAQAAVSRAHEGYKNLFAQDVNWVAIGDQTEQFSGAELENLINTALDEKLDQDEWVPVTTDDILRLRVKVSREYAERQRIRDRGQFMGFRQFTPSK
ncbi:ATP-binding protein [Candidatus Daviesbacteria bacterium]|nr:ATP-binding protein [Candidatus Daviesbacteria bacterium]